MGTIFTWHLPLIETIQAAICLSCLAINARMLRLAGNRLRAIVRSGENHGTREWANTARNQRAVLVVVQIFAFVAGIDRVYLSISRPQFYAISFLLAGFMRTSISVLVAWSVWSNQRAYEKLQSQ